jgi:uncharacterized protein
MACHHRARDGSPVKRVALPTLRGRTDPDGTVPAALLVVVFLFAWLPPYRVLMVWVYDRTESLLLAYLMHVPISTTMFILATDG